LKLGDRLCEPMGIEQRPAETGARQEVVWLSREHLPVALDRELVLGLRAIPICQPQIRGRFVAGRVELHNAAVDQKGRGKQDCESARQLLPASLARARDEL
jgi:hypothetical protein